MKKFLLVLLTALMMLSLVGCSGSNSGKVVYTYHSYSSSLASNWNPHTWETNADSGVLSYITTPFVGMSIEDSEKQIYQWTYLAATAVADVTKDHQDDLTKYKVTLPAGAEATDVTEGYVFEIALNKDLKWQDGTAITADDYVESFKLLLDPTRQNYRANLYYAGESAVAGGSTYFNSGLPIYTCLAYTDDTIGNYSADLTALAAEGKLYINVNTTTYELYSLSLTALNNNYLGNADLATAFQKYTDEANYLGFYKITAENCEEVLGNLDLLLTSLFGATVEDYGAEALFYWDGETYGEKYDYDVVGMYKVDDYTIRYVCQTAIEFNYFLTSLTDNWIVDKDLYTKNQDTTGDLVTTSYGTSIKTTKSYGPYIISSLQDGKQLVYTKNPYWFGYTKDEESGRYVGTSNYKVDGEYREIYQADKIVIDVMTDDAAKLAFLSGELDDWAPSSDDLPTYSLSDKLYKALETYTMSLFFDCNLLDLKEMDASKGNTNSVVLSSKKFRQAFSLAIDRAEWVGATQGYAPAYALLNTLYFYDIYNDPASMYRGTDEAKQAVVNLYGIEYGTGKTYATLDDAYNSVTGYNLTEAKNLMKEACEELVKAGLYTAGQEIVIRVAYKKGALDSSDNQQLALFNQYINAAAEGSGFGKITLEGLGSISDRYGDVAKGEYAIGYGAWGGAAFYPFRNFQVYMDPDQYDINEARDWDPTTETFTMVVNGETVTMTYQDWSGSMMGTGRFATADFATKLHITATLEEDYLNKFYRIPLASSTTCGMLSHKVSYYTEDYNIMYGWGGLELMKFNYTDKEWKAYVKNNTLSYE